MSFKMFKGTVSSKEEIAPHIFKFSVTPDQQLEYLSGQYFSFRLADRINRSYSIANGPEADRIEFVVDIAPGGPGSQFVDKVRVGEVFDLMGPFGFFTPLHTKALEDNEPLIFIATGTGIAPMRSMIHDLLASGSKREMRLYFGLRFETQMYFFDEFRKLAEEYPHFTFVPVISRPTETWKGETGHCQTLLMKEPPVENARIYICGRTETVAAMASDLTAFGYPKERVFFEKFG